MIHSQNYLKTRLFSKQPILSSPIGFKTSLTSGEARFFKEEAEILQHKITGRFLLFSYKLLLVF